MGDMSGKKDSSSSSSSNSTTTNNNIDRRQVVAEGAVGISTDGSTVNMTMQSMDAGIVTKALDTVAQADATAGQGFSQLLTLADRVITGAGGIIQATQQTTDKQMDIVATTANDAKGAIDQKTIMVGIGVAGAVAIAFAVGNKK